MLNDSFSVLHQTGGTSTSVTEMTDLVRDSSLGALNRPIEILADGEGRSGLNQAKQIKLLAFFFEELEGIVDSFSNRRVISRHALWPYKGRDSPEFIRDSCILFGVRIYQQRSARRDKPWNR